MATYKTTRLQAVNTILSNIGQSPVTNLDSGNPMVETAEVILDEIVATVQAEGWAFNLEYAYPFTPDSGDKYGRITLPDNILTMDGAPYSSKEYVQRGGYLYNKTDHTFTFTESVKLDVMWVFPFDEVPEAVKNYMIIRAANVFAGRVVGSSEAVRFGQQEEVLARSSALEYETQQGDYNIFQGDNGDKSISAYTYRPAYSIYR